MAKPTYIYCDSNVFLSYFNQEADRIGILERLFEEVQKDPQRKLITSTLSITEVAYIAAERMQHQPDSSISDAIDAFWGDSSLIEFVEFSEMVARQARHLIRSALSKSYQLTTIDAIHLSSAKFVGVLECFTYDKKLFKFADIQGYRITEPYVNAPRLPLAFPDDF